MTQTLGTDLRHKSWGKIKKLIIRTLSEFFRPHGYVLFLPHFLNIFLWMLIQILFQNEGKHLKIKFAILLEAEFKEKF